MPDLGAIGYGLDPAARKKEQAKHIARAFMPYLRESIEAARAGNVGWDAERLELCFMALDELAPLIDAENFSESEALLIHSALSFMLNTRKGGMLNDKKIAILIALTDSMVETYSAAADLLKIDVDRSGE